MKHNLKPNQYATALIEVAEQLGATQEVGASFHVVENLIRTNAQFRSFILSKRIPSDQKKQSLVAILGESCHLIVIEFLGMISGAQTIKLIRETGEMIQEKVKDSLNQAKEKATAIIESAEKQIQVEKDKAISEIKGEVANLAIQVAEKLIQKNLNRDDNQSLIDESLQKIKGYEA